MKANRASTPDNTYIGRTSKKEFKPPESSTFHWTTNFLLYEMLSAKNMLEQEAYLKEYLLEHLLTFFESYIKQRNLQETPSNYFFTYLTEKYKSPFSVKKMANNLGFSINFYAFISAEINFYYELLNQRKPFLKDVTNYLRCRKIVKEFYRSKFYLDDIIIPVESWVTLINRIFKDNATNDMLDRIKERIRISNQQKALQSFSQKIKPMDINRLEVSNVTTSHNLTIDAVYFIILCLGEFHTISRNSPVKLGLSNERSGTPERVDRDPYRANYLKAVYSDTRLKYSPQSNRFDNSINSAGPIEGSGRQSRSPQRNYERSPQRINERSPTHLMNESQRYFLPNRSLEGVPSASLVEIPSELQHLIEIHNKTKQSDAVENDELIQLRGERVKLKQQLAQETTEKRLAKETLMSTCEAYEELAENHLLVYSFMKEMQNDFATVISMMKSQEPDMFETLNVKFIQNFVLAKPVEPNVEKIKDALKIRYKFDKSEPPKQRSPPKSHSRGKISLEGFKPRVFLNEERYYENNEVAQKKKMFKDLQAKIDFNEINTQQNTVENINSTEVFLLSLYSEAVLQNERERQAEMNDGYGGTPQPFTPKKPIIIDDKDFGKYQKSSLHVAQNILSGISTPGEEKISPDQSRVPGKYVQELFDGPNLNNKSDFERSLLEVQAKNLSSDRRTPPTQSPRPYPKVDPTEARGSPTKDSKTSVKTGYSPTLYRILDPQPSPGRIENKSGEKPTRRGDELDLASIHYSDVVSKKEPTQTNSRNSARSSDHKSVVESKKIEKSNDNSERSSRANSKNSRPDLPQPKNIPIVKKEDTSSRKDSALSNNSGTSSQNSKVPRLDLQVSRTEENPSRKTTVEPEDFDNSRKNTLIPLPVVEGSRKSSIEHNQVNKNEPERLRTDSQGSKKGDKTNESSGPSRKTTVERKAEHSVIIESERSRSDSQTSKKNEEVASQKVTSEKPSADVDRSRTDSQVSKKDDTKPVVDVDRSRTDSQVSKKDIKPEDSSPASRKTTIEKSEPVVDRTRTDSQISKKDEKEIEISRNDSQASKIDENKSIGTLPPSRRTTVEQTDKKEDEPAKNEAERTRTDSQASKKDENSLDSISRRTTVEQQPKKEDLPVIDSKTSLESKESLKPDATKILEEPTKSETSESDKTKPTIPKLPLFKLEPQDAEKKEEAKPIEPTKEPTPVESKTNSISDISEKKSEEPAKPVEQPEKKEDIKPLPKPALFKLDLTPPAKINPAPEKKDESKTPSDASETKIDQPRDEKTPVQEKPKVETTSQTSENKAAQDEPPRKDSNPENKPSGLPKPALFKLDLSPPTKKPETDKPKDESADKKDSSISDTSPKKDLSQDVKPLDDSKPSLFKLDLSPIKADSEKSIEVAPGTKAESPVKTETEKKEPIPEIKPSESTTKPALFKLDISPVKTDPVVEKPKEDVPVKLEESPKKEATPENKPAEPTTKPALFKLDLPQPIKTEPVVEKPKETTPTTTPTKVEEPKKEETSDSKIEREKSPSVDKKPELSKPELPKPTLFKVDAPSEVKPGDQPSAEKKPALFKLDAPILKPAEPEKKDETGKSAESNLSNEEKSSTQPVVNDKPAVFNVTIPDTNPITQPSKPALFKVDDPKTVTNPKEGAELQPETPKPTNDDSKLGTMTDVKPVESKTEIKPPLGMPTLPKPALFTLETPTLELPKNLPKPGEIKSDTAQDPVPNEQKVEVPVETKKVEETKPTETKPEEPKQPEKVEEKPAEPKVEVKPLGLPKPALFKMPSMTTTPTNEPAQPKVETPVETIKPVSDPIPEKKPEEPKQPEKTDIKEEKPVEPKEEIKPIGLPKPALFKMPTMTTTPTNDSAKTDPVETKAEQKVEVPVETKKIEEVKPIINPVTEVKPEEPKQPEKVEEKPAEPKVEIKPVGLPKPALFKMPTMTTTNEAAKPTETKPEEPKVEQKTETPVETKKPEEVKPVVEVKVEEPKQPEKVGEKPVEVKPLGLPKPALFKIPSTTTTPTSDTKSTEAKPEEPKVEQKVETPVETKKPEEAKPIINPATEVKPEESKQPEKVEEKPAEPKVEIKPVGLPKPALFKMPTMTTTPTNEPAKTDQTVEAPVETKKPEEVKPEEPKQPEKIEEKPAEPKVEIKPVGLPKPALFKMPTMTTTPTNEPAKTEPTENKSEVPKVENPVENKKTEEVKPITEVKPDEPKPVGLPKPALFKMPTMTTPTNEPAKPTETKPEEPKIEQKVETPVETKKPEEVPQEKPAEPKVEIKPIGLPKPALFKMPTMTTTPTNEPAKPTETKPEEPKVEQKVELPVETKKPEEVKPITPEIKPEEPKQPEKVEEKPAEPKVEIKPIGLPKPALFKMPTMTTTPTNEPSKPTETKPEEPNQPEKVEEKPAEPKVEIKPIGLPKPGLFKLDLTPKPTTPTETPTEKKDLTPESEQPKPTTDAPKTEDKPITEIKPLGLPKPGLFKLDLPTPSTTTTTPVTTLPKPGLFKLDTGTTGTTGTTDSQPNPQPTKPALFKI